MTQGKVTDEEKETISFYKPNLILWDNADPNYRNKVKRSFIKVKLVRLFEGKFSEGFLEKCFHSLRTSMNREIKKSASGKEFIYVYLFIYLLFIYLFMFTYLCLFICLFIYFCLLHLFMIICYLVYLFMSLYVFLLS